MSTRTRKPSVASLAPVGALDVAESATEYRVIARTAVGVEYEVAPGVFADPAEADSAIHQDRRRYRDEVEHGRAQFPEYRVETRTVTRSAWVAAHAD